MATTVTIQPNETAAKDTLLIQSVSTANWGTHTALSVGFLSDLGRETRTLIQFDLSPTNIPAGKAIISATLSLWVEAQESAISTAISVKRAITAWFEGVKAGTAPDAGQDGSTWNLRNANGSVQWGSNVAGGLAGTDYSGTTTDSVSVPAGTGFWVDFNVTTDVQAFYAGTATNNGWWLLINSAIVNNRKVFTSSSGATAANRPKLVVQYRSPIAGTVAGTSTATATISSVPSVLTLQPDGVAGIDTQIRDGASAANNYGLSTSGGAGLGLGSQTDKTLIKFDLSALPPGAIVLSATLTLMSLTEDSTTDYNVSIHRSKIAWFEGAKNAAAPDVGTDGSTWNLRNANGSLAWSGGVGGVAGSDYETTPAATTLITEANPDTPFDWDVTTDLQYWQAGNTNNGWWIIGPTSPVGSRKVFHLSGTATASSRPKLTIVYTLTINGSAAGTSTATGTLKGIAGLEGAAAGTSTATATIASNQNLQGSAAGTSTATGFLKAITSVIGNAFGDSTATATIHASYHSVGHAAGTSSHVAHLKGVFHLQGSAEGVGTAIAHIFVRGQIRGSTAGTSTATATAYAQAVNVAAVIGCNPVPLLHITNGSVKSNGQLNILNFLNERAGYLLVNYKPQIFQYKDGGYWSSSPQSNGRRFRGKAFENVIDVLEVSAKAGSQDSLIQYQQDLLDFQEAASDYWASDYAFLPYYLVARAARETNTRYALVHMISCPELENPYTHPFFDNSIGATFVSLTIRIEHGIWMSTPPGRFDCVEVSGQREWTVSGWQAGS